MRISSTHLRIMLTLCVLLLSSVQGQAEEAVVYAPLSVEDSKSRTHDWLETRSEVDEDLRKAVDALWLFEGDSPTVGQRFDAVVQTFYLADASVRELVDSTLKHPVPLVSESYTVLETPEENEFFSNNLRYFYARYLAVGHSYEAALALFDQIDPSEVVDPAGCLFYQAVCQHSLLLKEQGLSTIAKLLEQTEEVPVRYLSVASLMQADLEGMEEKSLGEVARQMKDVRRRLSLGHGGPRVQEVEGKIIATLDELIEKMEQQQGGGSSSAGGQSQGQSQGNQGDPLEDSRIAGQKGPGEVDQKDLGEGDRWGGLPEKAEADAKNLINRQFPAHYRQAVEEYLKKLAQRKAP
ncbi:MAG: hypothetical protein KDA86_07240 [Planctomycetaceae bacterium]|nr:hypothetical protein [Planctomycetaceae bacterium]